MEVLTLDQLNEWEAFDKINPIGAWRDDFRIAQLMSLIQNLVNILYTKKGTEPDITIPNDFMIWDWSRKPLKKTEKKMDPNLISDKLLGFAQSHNKKLDKKKEHNKPPTKLKIK